jgi:hypothetical protein
MTDWTMPIPGEPTSRLEPLTSSHYECAVTYAAVCRSVRKRRINKRNLRFRRERQFAVYRRISPTLSSKLSSKQGSITESNPLSPS